MAVQKQNIYQLSLQIWWHEQYATKGIEELIGLIKQEFSEQLTFEELNKDTGNKMITDKAEDSDIAIEFLPNGATLHYGVQEEASILIRNFQSMLERLKSLVFQYTGESYFNHLHQDLYLFENFPNLGTNAIDVFKSMGINLDPKSNEHFQLFSEKNNMMGLVRKEHTNFFEKDGTILKQVTYLSEPLRGSNNTNYSTLLMSYIL